MPLLPQPITPIKIRSFAPKILEEASEEQYEYSLSPNIAPAAAEHFKKALLLKVLDTPLTSP